LLPPWRSHVASHYRVVSSGKRLSVPGGIKGVWNRNGGGRGILTAPIGLESPGGPVLELLDAMPRAEDTTGSARAPAGTFALEYAQPSSFRTWRQCSLGDPKSKIDRLTAKIRRTNPTLMATCSLFKMKSPLQLR
jgi:hypothetical protein